MAEGVDHVPGQSSPSAVLPGHAYYSVFKNQRPKLSFQTLQARLRRSKALCESLADHLTERALAEDAYVKSLQKLARKPAINANAASTSTFRTASSSASFSDESDAPLRSNIEADLTKTITVHETYARRLHEDVVKPIRESVRKGETQLRDAETQIAPIARDYDDAIAKVVKMQSKMQDASTAKKNTVLSSKLAEAKSELSRATQLWNEDSRFYFNTYQVIDRSRLNMFKEVLGKFFTMTNDLGRERMEAAESTLVHLFSFETDSDMKNFVSKHGEISVTAENSINVASPTTASQPIRENGANLSVSQNGQIQSNQNTIRGRGSADDQTHDNNLTGTSETGHRQTQTAHRNAEETSSIVSSGSGKHGTSNLFAAFKNPMRPRSNTHASSSNYSNLDEDCNPVDGAAATAGGGATPSSGGLTPDLAAAGGGSGESPATRTPTAGGGVTRRSSFLPSLMRRKNSTSLRPKQQTPQPSFDSTSSSSLRNPAAYAQTTSPSPLQLSSSPHQDYLGPAPNNLASLPRIDDEGFSVPPPDHDKSPWERAGDAGGGRPGAGTGATEIISPSADTLGDSTMTEIAKDTSSLHSQNRVSTMAIQSAALTETETDRVAALERVKSTLLSSRTPSSPGGSLARRTTRGRRSERAMSSINPTSTNVTAATAAALGSAAFGTSTASSENMASATGNVIPEKVPLNQYSASPDSKSGNLPFPGTESHRNAPVRNSAIEELNTTANNGDMSQSISSLASASTPLASIPISATSDKQQPHNDLSASVSSLDASPLNTSTLMTPSFQTPTFETAAAKRGRTMSIISTSSSNPYGGAGSAASGIAVSGASSNTGDFLNTFGNPALSGLRACIVETVHVSIKSGVVERILVTGEVTMCARDIAKLSPDGDKVELQISTPPGQVAKNAPNRLFLEPLSHDASENTLCYTLNLAALNETTEANGGRSIAVFKYQVSTDAVHSTNNVTTNDNNANLMRFVPLLVEPQWKCEDTKTSLIVNYQTNNQFAPSLSLSSPPSSSLLEQVLLDTTIDSTVSAVQAKPEGTWHSDRRKMRWKLGDLATTNEQQQPKRIIARFHVETASKPQPVSLKWRMRNHLLTGVSLNIVSSADGNGSPKFAEMITAVQAGKHFVYT